MQILSCGNELWLSSFWSRLRVVPRLAFLAWGVFHARLRFARSTIPPEKWGITRSLVLRPRFGHVRNGLLSYSNNCFLCSSFYYFRGLFIIDDKGTLRQITMNDLPVSPDKIKCCSNHKPRLCSWLFVCESRKKLWKHARTTKRKPRFFLALFSLRLRHSFARWTNITARNAGFHKSTVNSYCYSHLALNLTNDFAVHVHSAPFPRYLLLRYTSFL